MSDDNFHRLVHQVRGALGSSTDRRGGVFGTALTPRPPGLVQAIWSEDVEFVSTADDKEGDEFRRIAIFLDLLGAEASAPAAHVLDDTYAAVFTEAEQQVRRALFELERAAEAPEVREALRRAVREALSHLRRS